jgi:hypothetical protein
MACCVLCRAVVETALKEALERHTGQRVSFDYRTLGPLIDDAERLRVLSSGILKECRTVKELGDAAAHDERPLTLDEAHIALMAAQKVLKSVFVTPRPPGTPRPRTE